MRTHPPRIFAPLPRGGGVQRRDPEPRILGPRKGKKIPGTAPPHPPGGGGMIEAQMGIGGMVGWAWEGLSGRTF